LDNLTHSLVGLAAAKAGFEKLSPHATAVCIIAASLPDLDIFTLIFGGRWGFLKHHRAITHSLVGTIVLALILPLLFYLGGYIAARTRCRPNAIKVKGLIIGSLIVSATHPFMDWTNNYGIRLLLPWSPRWFYGDFVFILDPFLWLTFGGAAFLLTSKTKVQIFVWSLLALILSYLVVLGPAQRGGLSDPTFVRVFWICAVILFVLLYRLRVGQRLGAKIGVAAFLIAITYWGALAYAHKLALNDARALATIVANQNGESITELAAMPTLANPLHWQSVFETDRATYRFDLNLTSKADLSNLVRYEKPEPAEAGLVEEALRDRRARILMDFARFPVISVDPNCLGQTLVQFADLRYTEPGSGRGTFSLDVPVECPLQTP